MLIYKHVIIKLIVVLTFYSLLKMKVILTALNAFAFCYSNPLDSFLPGFVVPTVTIMPFHCEFSYIAKF